MKKITIDVLDDWDACDEGRERFAELFPNGADLKTVTWGLIADGHGEWAVWLYKRCSNDERFEDQAVGGCCNIGDHNSGDMNTGDHNWGDYNTGDLNHGDWNSGSRNAGDYNSGSFNTGDRNTGGWNSGHSNSGSRNSGFRNSGNWNSGHHNSGHFNSVTPDEILVFNKPMSRESWDRAKKPNFISCVAMQHWIPYDSMTEEQVIEHPGAEAKGGIIASRSYKDAWRAAWNETNDADRRMVLQLPNFDADVFLEITGIDVRKELES